MFQASPHGLMAPAGTPVATPADLRGGSMGVHVGGLKVMDLVKGTNGIDDVAVVEIPHADKFARAASGEFHAVQCHVIDEPIGVQAAEGAAPEVMRLSDHGLISTAQTIVAHDATLADTPDMVRAVLAAIFAGWEAAPADKPAAAATVVDRFVPEGSPDRDVAHQTKTLDLLEPPVLGGAGDRIGAIDPARWAEAARLMADHGIAPALPDLGVSLATGFWPAA